MRAPAQALDAERMMMMITEIVRYYTAAAAESQND